MKLGGWNYEEVKSCALPQKAASAFIAVTSDLVGAEYQPVLYAGSQLVNGTNYCIFALQKAVTPSGEVRLMKLLINEEPRGEYRLLSVSVIPM